MQPETCEWQNQCFHDQDRWTTHLSDPDLQALYHVINGYSGADCRTRLMTLRSNILKELATR